MPSPFDYIHKTGNSGITTQVPRGAGTFDFVQAQSNTSKTTRTNFVTFRPLFFSRPPGVVQLGLSVGTQNSRVKAAIYSTKPPADNDIYPQALVADLGEVVVTAVAGTELRYFTPSVDLGAGLYWVAATWDRAAAVLGPVAENDIALGLLGFLLESAVVRVVVGLRATPWPYATAWPSTAPAGLALETGLSTQGTDFAVRVRPV